MERADSKKNNGEVRQYYIGIVGKEAWRDNSFSYVQQHSDGIGGTTYTYLTRPGRWLASHAVGGYST